jgi:sulfatase modifying factor 1
MIIPDVKCVLGEPLAVQDVWRRAFESALTQRFKDVGTAGFESADERAEWTTKMEILSGGRNTVKWVSDGATTPKYFPTIMVRFPALRIRDLLEGSTNENLHPAFIVNSVVKPEIYVGKYQAYQITSNSKNIGISLYGVDPKTFINFDTAFTLCGNGGTGHHLITNAEWAMIALLCKNINAYQPKGNNNYGKDISDPISLEYYGIPTYIDANKIGRVGTGTGPVSWAHDGTPWGVYDMNGNVYEWCSGLRQAAGEIQVIPNNDAAVNNIDVSRDSTQWKAINAADGTLVNPEVTFASDTDTNPVDSGAGATLKYDATTPITVVTTVSTRTTEEKYGAFDDITGTNLPEIVSALCIAPEVSGSNTHGNDRIHIKNDASGNFSETLLKRGGIWYLGSAVGVFLLHLPHSRSYLLSLFGARPAFVNL